MELKHFIGLFMFYCGCKCLCQQGPNYSNGSAPHVCRKKSQYDWPVTYLRRSTGISLAQTLSLLRFWACRELHWSLHLFILTDNLHDSRCCLQYTAGRRLSCVPQSRKLGPKWPDPKWNVHRWYCGWYGTRSAASDRAGSDTLRQS